MNKRANKVDQKEKKIKHSELYRWYTCTYKMQFNVALDGHTHLNIYGAILPLQTKLGGKLETQCPSVCPSICLSFMC